MLKIPLIPLLSDLVVAPLVNPVINALNTAFEQISNDIGAENMRNRSCRPHGAQVEYSTADIVLAGASAGAKMVNHGLKDSNSGKAIVPTAWSVRDKTCFGDIRRDETNPWNETTAYFIVSTTTAGTFFLRFEKEG